MRLLLFFALLAGGCTFDPDLGGNYFPCKPDGTCPGGCQCLDGRVCVPGPDQELKYCAWCPEGWTICYQEKTADCARLLSDPDHCGDCNHACPAGFACEYGACAEGCREGLDDCEGSCVDLQTDPLNCGRCGNACGAGRACSLGVCGEDCPAGTENCDGACVDVMSDPAHCSGCGAACQLPNAAVDCLGGACAIFGCLDCWEDCDQLDETGCESCTETDPGNCGACGVACDNPPYPVCEADDLIIFLDTGDCLDGRCSYQSSPKPCEFGCENGACKGDPCLQVDCNLNQHCENGLCVCDDFYGDCDTSNLNGCEEDLLQNDLNCGTCGQACTYPDDTCCAGNCVDIRTDRGNCGRCNLFCSGMTECCGGTCTDIQMDAENCGGCGSTCTVPSDTCCYAHCVDVLMDASHCGDCGNECATNIPCHLGECGAQGIRCGTVTCDFWEEQCCYGVNGMACYPSGDCATRIVECDDDSDCGDQLYCCLVDNTQYVTRCASNCMSFVCSSAIYCALNDPANLHCCTSDFDGQLVNVCQAEFCQ